MVCVAPAWTSRAGACDVRLLHADGLPVPRAAGAAPFPFRVAAEWGVMDVSLSAADGLLSLAVHGAGFDARPGRVACSLVDLRGRAAPVAMDTLRVDSPSALLCQIPAAAVGARETRVVVKVDGVDVKYAGPPGGDTLALDAGMLPPAHSKEPAHGKEPARVNTRDTAPDHSVEHPPFEPTDGVTFEVRDAEVRVAEDSGWSMVNSKHSTLNTQHSTLNTQHSTLKPQPSTLTLTPNPTHTPTSLPPSATLPHPSRLPPDPPTLLNTRWRISRAARRAGPRRRAAPPPSPSSSNPSPVEISPRVGSLLWTGCRAWTRRGGLCSRWRRTGLEPPLNADSPQNDEPL